MHLAECLLEQWNPHLIMIVGAGVQQTAVLIHRHPVVNNGVVPFTIQAEPDPVDSQLHVVGHEARPHVLGVFTHHCAQRAQEEAGANLALDNVRWPDTALEENRLSNDLCDALVSRGLGYRAVITWANSIYIQHLLGRIQQIPVGICVLGAFVAAFLDDLVHAPDAVLAVALPARVASQQRRADVCLPNLFHQLHGMLPQFLQLFVAGFGENHRSIVHNLPGLVCGFLLLKEPPKHLSHCQVQRVVGGEGHVAVSVRNLLLCLFQHIADMAEGLCVRMLHAMLIQEALQRHH
mmetsp:Transcript_50045/g.119559  ORF Transcript_50045/g.119559 Transcript_50045/m.119559 type:complete len:292 (+) Transcript_50045:1158-2033(+)